MPYKTADKVIAYLNKQYIKLFRKARNLMSFDEMNVINVSHEIYDEALAVTKEEMVRLADTVYKKYRETAPEEEVETSPGLLLVLALMAAYNPTTKYVYENEADRKRAKFAESVISSDTKSAEVDTALRAWVGMNKQFADDVTFESIVKAYTDDGVTEVEWVTHPDDKRCKKCRALHGKIFPIDNIPPKPHINCRCYVKRRQ